ncbi:energy-coupling factor transporter transmembrane component T family protein [Agromyces mangrovi Wang et al. 2018]|uniref:energy-coupling factor transporter transmembrane component T family protein n=1 Tax=Agromyces mangrovi TaxID=1858653 RepID=UPI002572CC61|nr:energy-coupling factor transporter transmembrane protein EcfT [Agromyces mangrovi]BDZ63314.1 cobalt ABC transporter permease [Agromyces mangrovi]
MIGFAVPGTSVLHRMRPGVKLALLAAAVTVLAVLRDPVPLAAAFVLACALVPLAHLPLRQTARQVTPVLWLLAVAVPVHAWFGTWADAAAMALRILTAVTLAAVFTMTTRVEALLDTVQAALRRVPWIDSERVGLVLALTIRCVPLLAAIVREVLDARRARGAGGPLRAIAVPVIVRSLRTADAFGEALVARGYDD